MDPQKALAKLVERVDLSSDDMLNLMRKVMGGEVSPVLISSIIASLRMKGETVEEIAGAAAAMREVATPVNVPGKEDLLDTCGTGGDGASTFNISTLSAFVAAAAGVKVAKHGGRSVSSKCGSADILESLGANIMLSPVQVAKCIAEVGIGFMFAPNHHSAMKYAAPVRKELKIRTIFNILGTLTNPAMAKNQLLGVFRNDLVGPMARVLERLGSRRALVVHGFSGIDEISLAGVTHLSELTSGKIKEYTISPEDFGLTSVGMEAVKADSTEDSRVIFQSVIAGESGPAQDIVILNAGAAIYISGKVQSISDGVAEAKHLINSGLVAKKVKDFIEFTRGID